MKSWKNICFMLLHKIITCVHKLLCGANTNTKTKGAPEFKTQRGQLCMMSTFSLEIHFAGNTFTCTQTFTGVFLHCGIANWLLIPPLSSCQLMHIKTLCIVKCEMGKMLIYCCRCWTSCWVSGLFWMIYYFKAECFRERGTWVLSFLSVDFRK